MTLCKDSGYPLIVFQMALNGSLMQSAPVNFFVAVRRPIRDINLLTEQVHLSIGAWTLVWRESHLSLVGLTLASMRVYWWLIKWKTCLGSNFDFLRLTMHPNYSFLAQRHHSMGLL